MNMRLDRCMKRNSKHWKSQVGDWILLHVRLCTPSYCRMLRKQCHALRYVLGGEACNLRCLQSWLDHLHTHMHMHMHMHMYPYPQGPKIQMNTYMCVYSKSTIIDDELSGDISIATVKRQVRLAHLTLHVSNA